MIDIQENYEPLNEVEALVRSAGDYVRASGDLRPRVLETARAERSERRAQRRIWQVAILVVLLGMFTTTVRQGQGIFGIERSRAATGAGQLLFSSEALTGSGESNWEMVDSFTELRRRQAELLRLAL